MTKYLFFDRIHIALKGSGFVNKNKITFENMLAGLLLRFGKVNMVDLRVVQNDLFNRYGILMSPFAIDYRGITNHMLKMGDNYYPLVGEESKRVLEEKQGQAMKDYLDSLNVEDLVILKIKEFGSVPEHLVGTMFCEEQEKILTKLEDELKIIYVWNDDVPYDDYREICLTSFGRVIAFELEYKEQVDEFRELLKSEGYDVNLVPEFLRAQDFDRDVYDILNLDNFLLYCCQYDRAATVSGDTVYTPVKKSQ